MRPLLAGIIGALLAAPLSASAEIGRTAGSTLRRPIGARPIAMGEAYTAVSGGVHSMGYNPAGLAEIAHPTVETSYTSGILDDTFGFLGYAHPVSRFVLYFGLIYYDAGMITFSYADGSTERRKAQVDSGFLAGFALRLSDSLSVGATAKGYRFELAQEASAEGLAADGGVRWKTPLSGLSLGGAVRNLGTDVTLGSEGGPLPLELRTGAAFLLDSSGFKWMQDTDFSYSRFLFTTDVVKVRKENTVFQSGIEMAAGYSAERSMAVRLGYLFNRELESYTLGVGLRQRGFLLDYAFGVKSVIRNVHHLSLGIHF